MPNITVYLDNKEYAAWLDLPEAKKDLLRAGFKEAVLGNKK